MAEHLHLNDRQREAVEHGSGPLLVLAGAGSGKTRVIVHRIAYLIRIQHLDPRAILAVTFTNKAAGEMASRVERLLGDSAAHSPWISTFHSLCARLLRYEAPNLGLPRSFTIFDEDDQIRMLKEIARDMDIPHDRPSLATYQSFVERTRNRGWLPQAALEAACGQTHEMLAQMYAHYHEKMRRNGTLDFGDLLLAMIELLQNHPRARSRYLSRWAHILVDEFQDTNPAQYQLLKLLAQPPYNLTVVGDDDQSIYAWRGATVDNLLGFGQDFPGCQVVRLEQNYRSTQAILDLANAAIVTNSARLEKKLWTENGQGTKPVVFTGRDERDESGYIAHQIEQLQRADRMALGDIALFYRTNAQSRIYEEQLRRYQIPYRVIAGTSFYDRREIKDILAYLRLAVNPDDDVAAQRIANVPKRGAGQKTLDQVRVRARYGDTSFFEMLRTLIDQEDSSLRKAAREKLAHLCAIIGEIASAARYQPPSELTRWLIDQIRYRDHLVATDPDSAPDRYDNVLELINAMRDFEEESIEEGPESPSSLQQFLEKSALVQASDDKTAQDAVNLMTIHAAKGLEFPVVFLTGLEDGLVPLYRRGSDEPENVEEERRLCYVAMTRAKRRLFLTNCLTRRLFGAPTDRQPSRFLHEIPHHLVCRDPRGISRPDGGAAAIRRRDEVGRSKRGQRHVDERGYPLEDIQIPPDGLRMTRPPRDGGGLDSLVGRTARHRTFGDGRILRAEYSGGRIKLTIQFKSAGVKKVIRSFVEVL